MKRLLLYLLALAPLSAFADVPPTGYYRVQNVKSESYMSIVDTKTASTSSDIAAGNIDLEAIHMLDGFEENIAFNPSTICYIEYFGKDNKGKDQYNISGQGLDLHAMTGRYFNIEEVNAPVYQISAEYKSTLVNVTKNLTHPTGRYDKSLYPSIDGSNKNWYILNVDQSSSQYFGIKPEFEATGYHWATMYAGFPFKASSSDMKVYVVKQIDYVKGCAVIDEVTNVSAQTPVLFRCSSATPSVNKLTLLAPGSEGSKGTTHLVGNYYCNDVNDVGALYPHRNVIAYDENTMRMLGVDADGKPAFVKGSADNLVVSVVDGKLYLPANKAYLKVDSSAPDVLKIMTEEEYITGIEQITTSTTDGAKVIYDLQGRRVQAPSKGLYIVNGKKMIIR